MLLVYHLKENELDKFGMGFSHYDGESCEKIDGLCKHESMESSLSDTWHSIIKNDDGESPTK